jgi:hypothetical protein
MMMLMSSVKLYVGLPEVKSNRSTEKLSFLLAEENFQMYLVASVHVG